MTVVGTGDFRYEVVEGWEQLPAGWQHKDVAGVATDSQDRVYLITRADPRVIVYNKDGSFAAAWGEDEFTPRTHGITVGPDDSVYCVDDGGHCIKKFTSDGKLLLTLGTGKPSDTGYDGSTVAVDRARRPAVQPPDQPGRGPERRAVRLGRVRQLPGPPVLGRRRADPVVGRSRHRPRAVQPAARHLGPARRAGAGRRPRERPRPGLQPERRVHHRVAGRPAADPDLLARRRRSSTSASCSGAPGRSRSGTARRTRSSRPASASTTRAASSRAASKSWTATPARRAASGRRTAWPWTARARSTSAR